MLHIQVSNAGPMPPRRAEGPTGQDPRLEPCMVTSCSLLCYSEGGCKRVSKVCHSHIVSSYFTPTGRTSCCFLQADGIFLLLDRISQYATKWLNVSSEIREYLLQNDTKVNLDSIRNVSKTLI